MQNPTWGVTEQFLEVHAVTTNPAEIISIGCEKGDETQIVYFPVTGEKFFFAVEVKNGHPWSISSAWTQPFISVALNISSDSLTSVELVSILNMEARKAWSKGDVIFGEAVRTNSGIIIEPSSGPVSFSSKLTSLLHLLESHETEIESMLHQVDMVIQVLQISHIGNRVNRWPGYFNATAKSIGTVRNPD